MANAVEYVAGAQVDFGCCHHFHAGRALWGQAGIAEKHGPRYRVRGFEMAKMIGRVKAVKRPRSQLVQLEVVLLHGVVVGAQNEHAGSRFGPHHVVDYAGAAAQQQVLRVPFGGLADGRAQCHGRPQHAALGHFHAQRVGDDSLLKADFAAVGEARDHAGVLAPLPGESLLGGGVAVGVVQAFDVAAQHRLHAQPNHETGQVERHARLVAVRHGVDDPGAVGVHFQYRAHGAIQLGVEQHHVLAVPNGFEHHVRAVLHSPR